VPHKSEAPRSSIATSTEGGEAFMHGRYGHRHGRLHFRRPFPNRVELLERLEAYQRDLEQEVADVDDLIRHLRSSDTAEPQPTTQV
jgi:hypothetical protein